MHKMPLDDVIQECEKRLVRRKSLTKRHNKDTSFTGDWLGTKNYGHIEALKSIIKWCKKQKETSHDH